MIADCHLSILLKVKTSGQNFQINEEKKSSLHVPEELKRLIILNMVATAATFLIYI